MTTSVIISVDMQNNRDETIMIVGHKDPNKSVTILNAFQGQEALDIWKKLTEVRKDEQ